MREFRERNSKGREVVSAAKQLRPGGTAHIKKNLVVGVVYNHKGNKHGVRRGESCIGVWRERSTRISCNKLFQVKELGK